MKLYNLVLDGNVIGTTELEKADAPMGVVFGKIEFIDSSFGYASLKAYCLRHNIQILTDYPGEQLISTEHIPNLEIISPAGTLIKGQTTFIEGMDTEGFDVTIVGVPYPFFEDEFPNHVKANKEPFKNK